MTLRFVVQVKTASNTVSTVESNASQPFIVITNDCQWEGSEGTLLKNEAFSDQVCCGLGLFCLFCFVLCCFVVRSYSLLMLDRNSVAPICEYSATPFFESYTPKSNPTHTPFITV